MIIILEGPDGSGKTTLAKYFSDKLGYEIKHRSNPKTQKEKDEMMQSYKDDIMNEENIIWDRGFHSELVYGPIKRDKTYISIDQMLELEKDLSIKGTMVIYCTDEIQTLWKRCTSRGEAYIKNIDELQVIKDGYDQLMYNSKHLVPIFTYKLTDVPTYIL